ncbi:hypothetical protein EKG37_07410 [Robertmurraya yapensis]|uniref:Uncharacterized protein n=2 Tax=Bacillaceae TaxID=186817 RepID=A0A431WER3_9BACI|nr:hypothetical protein [Bacillus yapensis]RTR34030.1 hypothetical protein EKG37_07410 [Bacillus yapensis]TKS97348.1 hypothetical protein FAR12_07410 [Bacillus yapensis]
MKKIIMVLLSIFIFVVGGFVVISSGFLEKDNDRDIIKYEGRIYSNITEVDWFEKEKSRYPKVKRIGAIKRLSKSSFLLWNFSATKLPKGTVLYDTVTKEGIRPMIILAETENGEFLYYRWLPKE